MQTVNQSAPPKGSRVKRLTLKLKSLPIDPEIGIKLDYETAKCLRVFARYHGWEVVQKRDGDHIIIWRIG